ncbi:FHA domain-containing protein [Microbacterium sp. kSW2-24]|uniref:FHA domain-containing protein n=1 Tax=Microbacterium galbinum TaxID=2851646 RepID=UPI001FFCFA29|nr:FHA domain-containing protein [Microbacterium galbinum]MCK2022881.1 FHA domain-containing protein [Microbacterium galbinum]
MQTIYRPGQWNLIVIPGALVALPPDAPTEVVSTLWERLPAHKTLATVVDVLTTQAGGSFTALPPFVAAVAEGADVRIALRGGVAARVTAVDGAHELSGAEVTTWSERFIGGATRIEITVETVEGDAGLPVHTGIVRAAAVSADLESDDAAPLTGALGPAPVVVATHEGASATALAAAPVPLALFGGAALGGAALGGAALGGDAAVSAPLVGAVPVPPVVSPPVVTPPPVPSAVTPPAAPPVPDASVPDAPVADAPVAEPPVAPVTEEIPEQSSDSAPLPVIEDATLVPTEDTITPDDDDIFDQLFGATVHTAPAPADAPPVPPLPAQGDHDGATISAAELRALRQQPASADETPTAVLPVAGASDGPTIGRLRVSSGQVVELDRTVIIGRRPRSTRASGASLPHLIAVESPQQDISRSHLEVRPEGDTVVVIDLHTTNGSTLLRPGADPVRLHPGEQTLVLTGDVVDLGDGITVAFEDLP